MSSRWASRSSLFVHIHTFVHILYAHICTHILCTHLYTLYAHMCTHTHTHAHTNIYTCTYIHICIHAYAHISHSIRLFLCVAIHEPRLRPRRCARDPQHSSSHNFFIFFSWQFMNRAYALGVVHETHRAWARLVKGNAEEDGLEVIFFFWIFIFVFFGLSGQGQPGGGRSWGVFFFVFG